MQQERMLHPIGDRELWLAKAEDNSWSFPLYVVWRVDKATDIHYAHVKPAFAPYYSQGLTLIALLQPHDILGRTDQWVIPRRLAEALLHKAPGITPEYYYRWPDENCPPIIKTIQTLRLELKEKTPHSLAHEPFVQYLARERKLPSSLINVVLAAIAEEAPVWMIKQRKPLDLGFCRLLAVPFRANWKEVVRLKARESGIKLLALMKLPKAERDKALKESGLPELLASPHNIALRRGWRDNGQSVRLDYTLEVIAADKFETKANAVEAERQSHGSTEYVAHYEDSVEALYNYLVQALVSFVRKVASPFAQVCEGGRAGSLRFLPVSGRKIRVRDKTLRDYPIHIVAPDSRFTVFSQDHDPRLVRPKAVEVPKVPPLLPEADDMRERTIDGDFQLENGEGSSGMLLPNEPQIKNPREPMLPSSEGSGPRVDGAGDWDAMI